MPNAQIQTSAEFLNSLMEVFDERIECNGRRIFKMSSVVKFMDIYSTYTLHYHEDVLKPECFNLLKQVFDEIQYIPNATSQNIEKIRVRINEIIERISAPLRIRG